MDEPTSKTPSAYVDTPKNAEHFEAKQEATHRERRAYVATLTPEEQAKFAAIEAATAILEQAKVPYFMWTFPEDRDKRASGWHWCRETYHEFYSKEAIEELNIYTYALYNTVLREIVSKAPWTVVVYDRATKAGLAVFGPPKDESPL